MSARDVLKKVMAKVINLPTLPSVLDNLNRLMANPRTGSKEVAALIANDPAARVVMISAVDQRDKLTECIQTGAIDFIVKPFDKKRLRSFFTKYLTTNT